MAENPFINAIPNGEEGKQRDGKEPPDAFVPGFTDCGIFTARGNYNIVSCGPFSGNINCSGSLLKSRKRGATCGTSTVRINTG